MPKHQFRWNSKALSDRKSIFDRLVKRNMNYAIRVDDELKAAGNRIELNPFIGVGVSDGRKERRLILTSVPYIVFYGVKDLEITIYRVKHQKSMPPNFK